MKKLSKTIFIILILSILFILIKYIYNIMVASHYTSHYNYIVVGNNCDCQTFGKCKHTFISENGKFREIKKDFKTDKDNLYKIAIGTNTIAYFPYDIWYDMYKSLRYTECSNCIEYENAINQYLPKYKYKDNDKQAFDKVVDLIGKEKLQYIEYFIITDKNYYIFDGLDEIIYKYNKNTESLDQFIKIDTCDIDYFYEKGGKAHE